ncbi:Major facilitator superfamily domain general substrate transporter [Penicillium maclennaniae]|uniref:Major facilitator superfamily domain general substrate transporter n=1 Tax=Penicillium maclennaniae TaxID=1343394 RepID=UPI00253FC309|nr:Major facilitator superfamily domain general substrate transporter [Penicillium maclennaniae]KAJ5670211.1 Major facilitator superfamily domain general substrate transporter [Penicillium maclennaniae]
MSQHEADGQIPQFPGMILARQANESWLAGTATAGRPRSSPYVPWIRPLRVLHLGIPPTQLSHAAEYGAQGSGVRQCIIYFLGSEINTASFALYTFSLSVLVQAILIISMSGAADHGNYRKKLLILFAFVGSVATMLFLVVVPQVYLLGGFLAIVANTCFGASFVLLNSFLPVLVRHHPSILEGHRPREAANTSNGDLSPPLGLEAQLSPDDSSPLLGANRETSEAEATAVTSLQLSLSTRISSFGIGIGYVGAVSLQIIAILVVMTIKQTTFSLRLVLFLIGLWWFIFTIPAAIWLRARPGPPLLGPDGKPLHSWIAYMIYAWMSLGKTAMRARRLKDILIFLAAWFLLSDGIATVSGTAVLFAKTELNMKPAALGLINVVVMIAGVFGAFSWSYLSSLLHLRASQTIIACIVLFELIPLYGILGYLPSVQRLGIGLQQPWEMYPLGAVYGLVMGGLSSYCRSFFAELIPPGYEAAFYALYAITDKGSSVFGPAIVGAITDRYGGIRPAFLFLAILIFLPLPLMLLVDVDRGKRDALALGAELDQVSEAPGYGAISTRPEDQLSVTSAALY